MKIKTLVLLILIQAIAIPSIAVAQKRGAAKSRPLELRGSTEQRIEQNTKAINLGIGQIDTDWSLFTLVRSGDLFELKTTDYFIVDRGVSPAKKLRKGKTTIVCSSKENKIFVRAYAALYVYLLAHNFFQEFRKKLKITSGARSVEEEILMRTRGSCYYTPYAAEANDSLEESLHTRGNTIDISRRVISIVRGRPKEMAMSLRELQWMRDRLIADKLNGIEFEIDPIEESICYHIVVFPKS